MKTHGFIKDNNGFYSTSRSVSNQDILAAAQEILSRRFRRGTEITSAELSKQYLISQLSHLEHEVFFMIFLDNRHRVLTSEILFNGTIDGASIYPRECVKRALALNAAACIISHNHPSGDCSPSGSDKAITNKLKDAMSLVEIRILDHIVVAGIETYSFAEHGLI